MDPAAPGAEAAPPADAPSPAPTGNKRVSLTTRARRTWRSLLREEATPTRLGVAMGLGVLLGCSPLYGLQMILCVVLAQLFRLNKLAVLVGVQISTPPLTPFVVLGSVQLGHLLLYGDWAPLSFEVVKATPGKELLVRFFGSFALGGTLLGLALGAVVGVLTAGVVRRQRARELAEPPLSDAEVDGLYEQLARLPRQFRHYGAWKVRLDPVYHLTLPLLAGRREVVDLGAGMGLLAFLLRVRSPLTRVRCVEWDQGKAQMARRLNEGDAQVQIEHADARLAELGAPDAITLFDVLHYSPLPEQQAWLTRCAKALAPGGVLIVRELDVERSRWRLSERIERQAVKGGWNQGGGVVAWPLSDLSRHLTDLGLQVELKRAGRGLFKANALVVAKKG